MIKKFLNYLYKNNYTKNTILTYQTVLNQYSFLLSDIRSIKSKLKKYQNGNTAHLHYNVLITFYKWINNKSKVTSLQKVRLPKIEMKYMKIASKNFIYRKTEKNEQMHQIIRFLFETGIRVGELPTIYNISKQSCFVVGKGNKRREIFFNYETYKNISWKEIPSYKTIRLSIKNILGKQYTPHSLRRSFATHMLEKGASPKMVMLQLGHSKIETTFRYFNLSHKKNKKIYNKYF